MHITQVASLVGVVILLASCGGGSNGGGNAAAGDVAVQLWRGADLSYVNELEDCGALYRKDGQVRDPYEIFAAAGNNVVRLRLWHTPQWTQYSTLDDVRKSMRRAKAAGMPVLLDFHYSDDWADPGDQIIPAAWADAANTAELAQRVYQYTLDVLESLRADGLVPAYVQVGNEINTEILLTGNVPEDTAINWPRNVQLLNAGIKAVRDFAISAGAAPKVMLHIAQPEYVEPWFDDALAAGLLDFELIGVSYYPKWSTTPFTGIEAQVRHFKSKYKKDIVIVETAYPWTLDDNDAASNILGADSVIDGYPASIDGQRRFMIDLMQAVVDGGGLGVVYWEPAWISSACATRWGQGSHWENATLFDYANAELHQGSSFLNPATVTGPTHATQ
jgi:arabinogalactan endo-1,4-beta-galactosidase